jgi:uncharacterized damage-inducible protein DinB
MMGPPVPYLARLFEHDAWATRATIGSIKSAASPPPRVLAVMGHIIAAEWLWWARLRGEVPRFAVWPALPPDRWDADADEIASRWRDYIGGLDQAELARPVSYTNSQGEAWSSAVEDVLLHVVQHSSYHRGQVAQGLRESGYTPVLTDYIHARRQGFVR